MCFPQRNDRVAYQPRDPVARSIARPQIATKDKSVVPALHILVDVDGQRRTRRARSVFRDDMALARIRQMQLRSLSGKLALEAGQSC